MAAENTGSPGGYVGPAHPAVAENERLRVLVQALEEEVAAREEDGERLASAIERLIAFEWASVETGRKALRSHDALVARYAPGGPDPLPDPVEGDSGQAGAGSDVSEAVAAIEAILERNARLERDLHIARKQAQW